MRGWTRANVVTGYCVYEKKKNREIKNPKQIKLKNGRFAVRGTCGSCGKPIFRIGELKESVSKRESLPLHFLFQSPKEDLITHTAWTGGLPIARVLHKTPRRRLTRVPPPTRRRGKL